MKKIYITIFGCCALLSSCGMNELPVGSISSENAIESTQDVLEFRNGIYDAIRDVSGGSYTAYLDIQADYFIGTLSNGNRLTNISTGNFNSATRDIEGFWSNPYSYIAGSNYILPKIDALLASGKFSEADQIALHRYKGEALWARAYYYWYLADRYCNSYTLIDPNAENTGLPLVTEYDPSGVYSSYPGRSSLALTFKRIEDDLKDAYTELKLYEESGISGATDNLAPNAAYLSTYTVKALQARIALLKGDMDEAITKAEEVIAGPYTLTSLNDYINIWYADMGSELIFVPYGDNSQSSYVPATGTVWLSNTDGVFDYVAAASTLDLYDANADVRYDSFFVPEDVKANGLIATCPAFYKYPGNYEFNTSSSNALKNKPKPFRLSEIYLILAEAAAGKDEIKANKALNDLRSKRIYGYTSETYTGSALVNEIRKERARELIGEGFRMSDLRRWGLGFSRGTNYKNEYQMATQILVGTSMSTTYEPGYYKFVLPIPSNEMETNPQLAGHQNPGY